MVTYIFDASAVLRFLDGEAGVDRVSEVLDANVAGKNKIVISAVHWGEIIGIFYKRHGIPNVDIHLNRLNSLGFTVVPVNAQRAQRSARIKAEYAIPYIDAHAVELALDLQHHVIMTADFDMKPASGFATIEFLPTKQHH